VVLPPEPVVPPVPPPATQALFSQRWVPVQGRLQPPQWVTLVAVSTHAVPHIICPPGQLELQLVPLQTWLAAQTLVQLPQWVASDATQEPLQSSRPAWHWHWLFWQIRPPLQGMPQAPQLFESDAVFTHSEPQSSCPAAQPLVPPAPLAPRPPVPGLTPSCGVQAATNIARHSPKNDTNAVFIVIPFEFRGASGPTCRRTW
jgi:hypothetical protein